MATITYEETLETTSCWCGIQLAIPANLMKQALKKGTPIYCPLGHTFVFGDTEMDKLKEKAERLALTIANREEDLRAERASHIATKGKLTKTAKKLKSTEVRAANGVCPCCSRSFTDTGLARHIATKHPEFAASA